MRKRMLETEYRASRVCRVLGNPTAYQIIKSLIRSKKTPTKIAEELGLTPSLISATLRVLRNIDLLRYKTDGREKIYWIKDNTVPTVTRLLEKFVTKMRQKYW